MELSDEGKKNLLGLGLVIVWKNKSSLRKIKGFIHIETEIWSKMALCPEIFTLPLKGLKSSAQNEQSLLYFFIL